VTGRLDGRIALIIGAGRGIGLGIAERFAEEGARVAIADTIAEGKRAAAALGAHFIAADIADVDGAERAVAATVERYGGLDIMVQNAGIYPWTLIENTSAEEWDTVLGVNLRGCFLAAKAALPHMKGTGRGRMLFTSSITGPHVTNPGHGHYAATKAGINGFIRAAALEFSGYGITVNGVEPGNILTEAIREHRGPAYIASMEAAIPLVGGRQACDRRPEFGDGAGVELVLTRRRGRGGFSDGAAAARRRTHVKVVAGSADS
jgi:3-oxoacyl-[acyl-carrier protein] reductase